MRRALILVALGACGAKKKPEPPPSPPVPEHRVEVKRHGAGMVRSTPEGITCGDICEARFPEDTEVTLTGTSTPTSAFFGWAGGGCRSGPTSCTFRLGEPTVVQAFLPTVRESRWQARIGGAQGDFARDLAVDADGNAWLLLQTEEDDHAVLTVHGFDPLGVPRPAWEVVATEHDATVGAALAAGKDVLYVAGGAAPNDRPFVAALAPDGTLRWDVDISPKYGEAFAVTVTPDGGAVVGGTIFVASYSPAGKQRWIREAPAMEIRAVAASDKWVAVAGTVRAPTSFGGKRLQPNGADAFVAVLDTRGRVLWARRYGGDGQDEARAITFIGDDLVVGGAQDEGVPFVARLDGQGEPRWWKRWEALDKTGYVADLVYAADGRVHATGLFIRAVSLGPFKLAAAQNDGFLVSYSQRGDYLSAQRIGSADGPTAGQVAPMPAGGLVVAATFDHRFDLAGGAQTSEGKTDALVARLSP